MKYELDELRISKVSVEDSGTELRFVDEDLREVIIILLNPTYGVFKHNKKYKIIIEELPEETQGDVHPFTM